MEYGYKLGSSQSYIIHSVVASESTYDSYKQGLSHPFVSECTTTYDGTMATYVCMYHLLQLSCNTKTKEPSYEIFHLELKNIHTPNTSTSVTICEFYDPRVSKFVPSMI